MNAPFVVAQANSTGSTTGTGSVRTIKVTKPANEQAVTVQLGYDQAYKLDLSSIANEKITLVHIGEKLIILFENKSTVTVEPFFDSMNAPLSNVTVEANGRDFTGSEFASAFPITTDQSVLTAAGVAAAGTPSSGADFHGPSVDPLSEPKPLDLLGQEELPNWTTTPQRGLISTTETTTTTFVDTTPPTAAAGVFAANEKGLPGQEGEGGSAGVGSGEIADGNAFNNSDPSETTAGALSFSDSDGTAHISLVNGTPVIVDGTVIVGAHGVLTINLDGTFTYTLTGNDPNHTSQGTGSDGQADVFSYTVEDSSGNTQSSTLTIDILDDVPTARPDTDSIAAGETVIDGNVINGAGTNEGFNGAGHDTQGADGATVTGVVAGTNTTPVTGGAGLGGIAGSFGTLALHADGSYEYTRTAGTAGGGSDVFTYTLTDGDGDTSVTTLTINVGDSAPTLHVPSLQEPGTQVSEAGLPLRGAEPAGSASAANSEVTSGTISFTSLDGVSSVQIGGVAVTPGSLPQTIASDATGTLVVTGYSFNAGTGVGSVNYTYTLTDNTLSDPSSVSFAVAVTDADNDAAISTLTIAIVDDAPLAVNDTDTLSNITHTAAGNVITAVGTTNAGADTLGADGAVVSAILSNNPGGSGLTTVGAGGATINGQFGTLTIGADGEYSYTRSGTSPLTAAETFTYTLKDGDGDTSTATLTISINDGGVSITNLTPEADGGDVSVNEDDLVAGRGPGESAGSDATKEPTTQTGTFNVSAPDGLSSLTVDGHAVITGGVFSATSFTTTLGNTLSFTGFNAGQVTYSYTLVDNETHPAANGANSLFENFAVVLKDVDNSTANDILSVNIIDDVPTAVADTDSVAANKFTAETGNVITAVGTTNAGADTLGADGAAVSGVAAGSLNANLDSAGTLNTAIQGTYGKLTLQASGSYSYVRDAGTAGGNSDVFTYTLKDGDGDMSHATLTIAIGDSTPSDVIPAAGGATTTVFEAGLPARIGEAAGSNSAATTETTSGTISFISPDGLLAVSLGGHALTGASQTFTDATGSLTASYTYNAGTGAGTISYSYTLLDNTLVDPSSVSFAVVVTDADSDSAPAGNLVINIVDDVPTAVADTDSVAANKFTAETGNVITAVGTTNAGADTLGADGATVTGVAAGNTNANLNNSGVNAVIQGTYGKLTLQADGFYSYVRDAGTAGGNSDVFTYTLKDGDGDMSHATLTIAIGDSPPSDTIPAAGGATTTVFEKGLPPHAGLPAGSGEMTDKDPNNNSDTSETTSGTISFSSPDGLLTVSLGGHALTGAPQTFTDATGSLTASYTYNAGAGTGTINYSYTLLTNTSGDNTSVSFGVAVTDLDGDSAPAGNLVINIVDDVPAANFVLKSLVPAGHDTNLMLVLDVSGSMGDSSGLHSLNGQTLTRLAVMKAAVTELLDQYGDLGDVRVQIVAFSSDASQAGTDWMRASAQAKAAVSALVAGGTTDYDAAVASAESLFPHAGKLTTAGVQNVSYFMSDGVPNESNGTGTNGIVGTEITDWQNFLHTYQIDSFALGMGAGATQSTLNPLAYNGVTNTDANAIIVTDMGQLATTLVGTISGTSGNILTDGNLPGSFGADGGHVQSITVNDTVYTYNPAAGGSISVSNGPDHGSFDTTTNTETVTLASGGVLTMIMDNGTYTYTAPANVTSGFTDTIPFVLVDNDGDTAGNNLQIVISTQDHAPIVRDDHVLTNAPAAGGSDVIVIPDWALLFNDSDAESQAIAITAVTNGPGGSVAHAGGVVTFTEDSSNATDGGSFTYTGSTTSPAASDTANVIVDRIQIGDNPLEGSGLSDVLIGRNGSGSTIHGYEGNDALVGGNQNDTLDGGTGNDLMGGGAGNDTYIVDSVGDQIIENANEGTDTVQSSVNYTLGANVENLTLTGSANINGTGNGLNNVLTGNSGNNTLDGGAGTDTLVGGSGNDTYIVDSTTDTITESNNNGTDTVQSSVTFSLAAISNVENLTLTGGSNINATGSSGDNTIVGNTGDNIITGGNGKDIMTGGGGNDTFDFNSTGESSTNTNNADVITDFVHGQDIIDLSAIDPNSGVSGDQAFTFNGATATARGVWITQDATNTYVNMDTSGNTNADMIIVLTGINKGLTAADFHL